MQVTFGLVADGRAYPEYPHEGEGILGGCVVGLAGLLNLIATQLGLTRPPSSSIVRTAVWQRKMEAAASPDRFWTASFLADPWSTSRLVLSWRDSLREGGWTASGCAEGRLADLAAAEASEPALPLGRGDLLWECIEHVEADCPLDFDELSLIDSRESLGPGWQRLVSALEARGVSIVQLRDEPATQRISDLGRAQAYLLESDVSPLVGDDSLVEISAGTTMAAAELIAEWLASGELGDAVDTVIIAPDGDTALIDLALAKRGLPQLGLSPSSSHRGTLQLLPLAFAAIWKPFNPQRLMELLLLPRSPIPRRVARRFTRALENKPGRGAVLDAELWAEIEAELKLDEPVPDASDIEARLKRWRAWLDVGHLEPAEGIAVVDAVDICKRVRDWALGAAAGQEEPLLASVVVAASALTDSLRALGKERVSRLQLERMVEQAIEDGLPNPEALAEVGSVRAVDCPGALWRPVKNVIWWNFTGPASVPSWPWSGRELASLEAAGCAPEPPRLMAERRTADWQRVVLNASERLLLVRGTLHDGAATVSHPLSHRLAPLLHPETGPHVTQLAAESLLAALSTDCGGRRMERTAATQLGQATRRPNWGIPLALGERLSARRESATSLEDLTSCHLKWLLKHVARLRPGGLAEVPHAARLFGNLAHAIAQEVFVPGDIPDPDLVRALSLEVFDTFVEEMAAPLLQPGLAGELAYARSQLPGALAALAAILRDGNLVVESMEDYREHEFGDGFRVHGRLDMLARSPAGLAVIDLKWSGEKYRRSEIADGNAIQLATYGRLINPAGDVPSGYYVINARRLIVEEGSTLPGEPVEAGRSIHETWPAVIGDWKLWRAHAASGLSVACGIAEAAEHMPSGLSFATDEGACRFCDYRALCRVDDEA